MKIIAFLSSQDSWCVSTQICLFACLTKYRVFKFSIYAHWRDASLVKRLVKLKPLSVSFGVSIG